MLYFLIFLILPPRAVFDKIIEISPWRSDFGGLAKIRLKFRVNLVRVLFGRLFNDLRGPLGLFDLAIADNLLVPLMNGHIAAIFLLCDPLRHLVDLRLLPHLLQLSLGAEELSALLQLFPPHSIIKESLNG
jgi:hypothetical protein